VFNPIDIQKVYADYINKKNEENRKERYDGNEHYFQASNSGNCARKIFYTSVEKVEPTNPPDDRSSRLLRLGTIVHEDLQSAFTNIVNYNSYLLKKEKEVKEKKFKVHMEEEIQIPEFNVRGFYDLVIECDDKVYLYDFKTMASFSWSLKFGRKYKSPNQSDHQELQLGTYGYAIKKKFGSLDGMFLCYYKKDDSRMKIIPVSLDYVDKAKRFWKNVNEEIKGGLPMFNLGVSPASSWNCRYCQFYDHCRPPSF
tara:strand:+ start:1770 stop:2531 length:762 start_codon:yes stop_codon:yes gene_type:complete